MNDFFDTLEKQLIAATPNRAARVRRARLQRAAAVASIIMVLLVGGAGIAAAVGGGDGDGASGGAPAGRHTTTAPAVTTRTVATPPDPSSYVTSVLNGTAIPGLGRGVAVRLQQLRFKIGNVTNAARQDVTETTVYYRTPDCIPAATQVASALRLGNAEGEFALRKMTAEQKLLAGKNADVVVVVGANENVAPGP